MGVRGGCNWFVRRLNLQSKREIKMSLDMVVTAGKAKKGYVNNFLKNCFLKTGDTLDGVKRAHDN